MTIDQQQDKEAANAAVSAALEKYDAPIIAQRVIKLFGGKEAFLAMTEARTREFNKVWSRDSEGIGAVLHAHLVVEHYLTLHLQTHYLGLPDLVPLRLTFAAKLGLVSETDFAAKHLKPGLVQLNAVRNKLAHRLHLEVQASDVAAIDKVGMYAAMRDAFRKTCADRAD